MSTYIFKWGNDMKKPEVEEKKLPPIQLFEELYILTFEEISQHVCLLLDSYYDRIELLVRTYVEVYKKINSWPDSKEQIIWIQKLADNLAENEFGINRQRIDKVYDKSTKIKLNIPIDETSIYVDIEERLQELEDNKNQGTGKVKTMIGLQGIFSAAILLACITILLKGIGKIKDQLDIINQPLIKPFENTSDNEDAEDRNDERIVIDGKVVYLSGTGKVLYSLPLEETDLAGNSNALNYEIQKQNGWTYYLPSPEREDTCLSNVAPFLYYTLYRMDSQGEKIEIVAEEVDDYTFWGDYIYVSQFGRIMQISEEKTFNKEVPGINPEVINNEIYIYDVMGKPIIPDLDGKISLGDRIFTMSSVRIKDVETAVRTREDATYYFKNSENGKSKEIYRKMNGQEEIYIDVGIEIDSFCVKGDWLYFSAYIRQGKSGAQYSELYRKSLTEDKKPEKFHKEFTGRILEMYYSEERNEIYANYTPKNWKSNHGIIAIISMSGKISYLNDEEQRQSQETTGNDVLEFVMVFDNQVYCYWKDCIWKPGDTPVAIWRKVLVIPSSNRIRVDD